MIGKPFEIVPLLFPVGIAHGQPEVFNHSLGALTSRFDQFWRWNVRRNLLGLAELQEALSSMLDARGHFSLLPSARSVSPANSSAPSALSVIVFHLRSTQTHRASRRATYHPLV